MKGFLSTLFSRIAKIGADPNDADEVRLQKAILITSGLLNLLAAFFWGVVYILLDEWLAGLIPLSYCLISILSIVIFAHTRRYLFFRITQPLLILLLPFLLMLALGGFINSSAVILWSLFSPLLALLLSEPRSAWRWFILYALSVILSAFLQPYVRLENNLSPQVILIFFVMNIVGVSSIAFVLLYYFVGQKAKAMQLLRLEQEKSESLLLNVLPKEIALTLKDNQNNGHTIAEQFEAVSILFADVVGFTPLSAVLAPADMVDLLNNVFSHFDTLVAKYGLEKIRTIGDNYMVASGVPQPRPDHARALALMALEMCAATNNPSIQTGRRLQFRIGLNCGAVVAGVIGRQKFHYDIWGDAVNIASRMESHGVPGKIQITRAIYDLLKDEFVCVPRGKIKVKGKGEMETWYLEGIKTP